MDSECFRATRLSVSLVAGNRQYSQTEVSCTSSVRLSWHGSKSASYKHSRPHSFMGSQGKGLSWLLLQGWKEVSELPRSWEHQLLMIQRFLETDIQQHLLLNSHKMAEL
jgi:hypothetical protein